MQRIVCYADIVAKYQADDHEIQLKMQSILAIYAEQISECNEQIKNGRSLDATKTQDKITLSKQILEIVLEHREQLIQNGEPEEFAEMMAHESMLNSTQDEIITLLHELRLCDQEIQSNRAKMVIENSALSFYEGVIDLLNCSTRSRHHTLEVSSCLRFLSNITLRPMDLI